MTDKLANQPFCPVCGSTAQTLLFNTPTNDQDLLSALDTYRLCDPSIDPHACGLLHQPAKPTREPRTLMPSARLRTTRNHLRDAATEALEMISGRDCAALDIGCNDGTLLSFYPRWVDRFGVDPHESVEEIGEWAWSARASFPSAHLDQAFGTKQFDIITCISTFEEVSDPRAFLACVRDRLAPDGLLVLETLYAPVLLTANSFDLANPDLCQVFSLQVLEYLVRQEGLKIVRGGMTNKNGGSIRLFIAHDSFDGFDFDPWSERLARLWDEETVLALRDRAPYQAYYARLCDAQRTFQEMIADIVSYDEEIAILGTDDQALDLMTWAGPTIQDAAFLVRMADRDHADGTSDPSLPVLSETECRARQPAYLLAPAARKQEALEMWRESIMAGAKLIIPTPAPHIIDAVNYSTEFGKTISQGDSAAGVETLRAILFAAGGPRLIAENTLEQAESA
ncbi:MAG: class I SAM-dependent methyltransferase [Pseudomonadota bacterium]